nr:hypothetical protein BaRGS_021769 [Batillaria attramentaria]
MPRKRATRVNKRAKPKMPDGEVGADLEQEERQQRLDAFLKDFDMEVQNRLQNIEKEKIRLQHLIEKEINLQLSIIPLEVRNMNIMDFVAAGGTVDAALTKLNGEDSFVEPELETIREDFMASRTGMEKTSRKGKGAAKGKMPPPSAALSTVKKTRSRFQTPSTRRLPAVWDTPAITPKFDINLPFTPGVARAPKNGERLMSLAGSPVDISTTQKVSRTVRQTRIREEEEDIDGALQLVAAEVPDVAKTDIRKILSLFAAAKNAAT